MEKVEHDPKTVLIAPSWQEGNILESCGVNLFEPLLAAGYDVTVRPHPQYIRRYPQKLERLMADCKGYDETRFRFQLNFSSNETVFSSDLVVTDWSNIGYEYAMATTKPVLFINTPRKIVNEAWTEADAEKYAPDDKIRSLIGITLNPEDVGGQAAQAVDTLIAGRAEYAQTLEKVRRERLYHFGESGKYGAQYLIERMVENQKKKKD
jgi:YidC/Oxa1 family membrane protein insertase